MLNYFAELPRRTIALSPEKGFPLHRCEPVSMGLQEVTDPRAYAFDNSRREKFCLFQFTLAGTGHFRDEETDHDYTLQAGQGFLVVSPSRTRYWLAEGDRWTFIYALFVGDMAWHHVGELIAAHGFIYEMSVSSRPIEILRNLYEESVAGGIPDKFSRSALLYGFLMEMRRRVETAQSGMPGAVSLALRRIEESYGDGQLGVDALAREAGLSRFHFSRLFRKHTGESPYARLIKVRLEKALDLLLSTNMPVKHISGMVGFRDYAYFCNVFRRHYETTPGGARKSR